MQGTNECSGELVYDQGAYTTTYVQPTSSSGDKNNSGSDMQEIIFITYDSLCSSSNVNDEDNVVPTEKTMLVESTAKQNNTQPQVALEEHISTLNNENITSQRIRRKITCPDEWSRNISKKKIQSGEAHVSISSGKEISAKNVRPKDCSNCIRKCNSSFSEEERITINKEYWNIENINRKRQFLSGLIDVSDKGSCTTKSDVSKRQKTRKFYMVKDGERIQVCQGFFLATFCISNTVVENIIKKRSDHNIVEEDRRGKHVPGIKRPNEIICTFYNYY